MRLKLFYSLFILLPITGFAQNATFEILPYLNGTTSIKEGQLEIGPELKWDNIANGKSFLLRPIFRMPLTNKNENVLQIDRFSSTWRSILSVQYTKDNTKADSSIKRNSFNLQVEYGQTNFKYYPTGNKSNEIKSGQSSYAFEIKYVGFFTKGKAYAKQFSPQFRLRYSYDWKAANEVGVLNAPNSNGVITTSNLIIDKPTVSPTFSPAFSLQIYTGKNNFSYSPTIYYDLTGKGGQNNPFNNMARLRLESWVFFYPLIKDNSNVKIGLSPFLSIRTKGTDKFNAIEYGGQLTIKFGTTFLQFL